MHHRQSSRDFSRLPLCDRVGDLCTNSAFLMKHGDYKSTAARIESHLFLTTLMFIIHDHKNKKIEKSK